MPEKIYYQTQYESPLGTLTLGATGDALVGLWLPGQKYFAASVPVEMTPNNDLPIFLRTRDWLNRYFAGEQPSPAALSLAPSGSDFRRMIWDFLLEIPYGQTVTYGRLADLAARKMNRPHMSAQAVGGAVGHNPISIIIPCHRVLGTDGSFTGYAGGVEKKRWLLAHEGALSDR